MNEERRRRIRLKQSFHATYRQLDGPTQTWQSTGPVDFSLTGARFRSPHWLQTGALLELSILNPKAVHPFTLRARVIWDKAYPSGVLEYGITFIEVTPEQQQQLEKLVETLLKARPKA